MTTSKRNTFKATKSSTKWDRLKYEATKTDIPSLKRKALKAKNNLANKDRNKENSSSKSKASKATKFTKSKYKKERIEK